MRGSPSRVQRKSTYDAEKIPTAMEFGTQGCYQLASEENHAD